MTGDLTRTASTSAQVLAMELGITDTAKKAKVYDLILALLTLEREKCARIIEENMLCGDDRDGTEVLHPRSNPGNKVGLAYAAAIRRGAE